MRGPPPPGTTSRHCRGARPPAGHARQRDSAGPPCPHTRAHSTLAEDPDCPPRGRAAGGGRARDLRRPSQRREAPPPGTPSRHPHSAQRRLARAHAVGPVLGPHAHTTRAWETRATGPGCPPQGRAAGRGRAPETRRPSQRWEVLPPPPGRRPAPSASRDPPQGTHAKGAVPGPHARTPAPTVRGQRTPTARPKDGQPGEDERLTSDTPHNGARHPPPQGRPPTTPTARNAGSQERTLWGRCWVPTPTPPAPGKHGQRGLAARPRDGRPGEGEPLTPDSPHNGERSPPPPGRPPATPAARDPPQGGHAKGAVPGPHARTAAPTARWHRTPTARPGGGQPGEDERLTSDAPHNGARHPPRGRPPATPTARNAGSQERTLWGRCWIPTPTPPAPGKQGQWDLIARPRDGRPGEGERLKPDAPHNGERSPPPRDDVPPPPRRATPRRPCTPKGQCRAPTLAHPRPRHVGSGPRPPAPRTGSRGRTSARPQTPLTTARGTPPPGTPPHHPHSAQRRLARAHAVGPVLGPHAHTTRARETRATGPGCPPQGRAAGRGRAPDTRLPSQR